MNKESRGCIHYSRGCWKECSVCLEYFPCWICHDEKQDADIKNIKKHHHLDRHATKNIMCSNCTTKQPVGLDNCIKCGEWFAAYICHVCHFYDDKFTEKRIFHCEGCGICWVGGWENFFHCPNCIACLPISTQETHKCFVERLGGSCPVCLEDLFTSWIPSTPMPCGHFIHPKCM